MIKINVNISPENAGIYEDFFVESECVNFSIEQEVDSPQVFLCGYFDDKNQAESAYKALRETFNELPEKFSCEEIFKSDFQNEYKKYLKAFKYDILNWVPIWEKENYKLEENDIAFYFDAGMAFGTGDHPTTRLCAMRLMDILKTESLENKSLIDAGCGSGILALSASLLGCKNIFAFDIDEDSIQVSKENAVFNNISLDSVKFETGDLKNSLSGKSCDILLANIQADVLMNNADFLLNAVNDNGILVLSGILKSENSVVMDFFKKAATKKITHIETRALGDWSDILIKFYE